MDSWLEKWFDESFFRKQIIRIDEAEYNFQRVDREARAYNGPDAG